MRVLLALNVGKRLKVRDGMRYVLDEVLPVCFVVVGESGFPVRRGMIFASGDVDGEVVIKGNCWEAKMNLKGTLKEA